MSGVIVARITDVLGDECAKAAVDPAAPIWHFVLTRDCVPMHVEVAEGAGYRKVVKLQAMPAPRDLIVAVHVRVTVSPELERIVLWWVAFTTWHLGRFR